MTTASTIFSPDFPTHWLLEGKSECPETVVMGGRHFRVFGNLSHPSSRRGGQSLLATTYWTDVTEQDSLREENESRRPIVSVIVIDNYEELMKAGSEASRSAVLAAIDEKDQHMAQGFAQPAAQIRS